MANEENESEKTWPHTDEERACFADWKYAVVSGDTLLGFRAFCEYEWDVPDQWDNDERGRFA